MLVPARSRTSRSLSRRWQISSSCSRCPSWLQVWSCSQRSQGRSQAACGPSSTGRSSPARFCSSAGRQRSGQCGTPVERVSSRAGRPRLPGRGRHHRHGCRRGPDEGTRHPQTPARPAGSRCRLPRCVRQHVRLPDTERNLRKRQLDGHRLGGGFLVDRARGTCTYPPGDHRCEPQGSVRPLSSFLPYVPLGLAGVTAVVEEARGHAVGRDSSRHRRGHDSARDGTTIGDPAGQPPAQPETRFYGRRARRPARSTSPARRSTTR